jgi:hypothetical protein
LTEREWLFNYHQSWRSGVSAERRHLKKTGGICGGLPTRRYGEGESFAVLNRQRRYSDWKMRSEKFTRAVDLTRLVFWHGFGGG